jgi:FAD/FMN-containing dehydrogenase
MNESRDGRAAWRRRRAGPLAVAAGATVLGIDPLTRGWVTAAQAASGEDFAPLPPLDGRLHLDDATRAAYADDFGHIVHQRPRAVLEPGSVEDVCRMVRFARRQGVRLAARGQGHSTFGQAQVEAGVVVDLSPLRTVHALQGDRITVDAGLRWGALLQATLARGLTPPALTDYLQLSVGGTLSVGGVSVTSWRHGAQVDNVDGLEVVTGEGELVACSPSRRPDLFAAALAGQGQCAIIVRATLRLVPAPSRARFFTLVYPDLPTLTGDCRRLVRDGRSDRFDTVQGLILPAPTGGWTYLLEAVAFFRDAPPDDARLLAGLRFLPGTQRAETRTYAEWANRLEAQVAFLQSQGLWTRPHPWLDLFVPDGATEAFVGDTLARLTPEDLGPFAPILLFPLRRERFTRPLFRVPESETVFLFDILRTAPADAGAVARLVDANRGLFERNRAVGGTHYPIGALRLSRQDWERHYGAQWGALVAARRRYDPDGVFASGPDIFRGGLPGA